MNKKEAKKRITKLRKEIDFHRYRYHVLDRQEISDGALDSLKNELYKLEMEYPEFIVPNSPTQRIGGKPLDKFEKVIHASPMYSMFDSFSKEDIKSWQKRNINLLRQQVSGFEYFCELKMDGLAAGLVYRNRELVLGATRGDGKTGENVTGNLKTIESIPLVLRMPDVNEIIKIGFSEKEAKSILQTIESGRVEARGETIMTKKSFNELNKKYAREGKKLLANPRNGAAGSIRQLNPKIAAERKLDFYVYSLIADIGFKTHEQEHVLAKLLGFKVLSVNKVCKNIDEIESLHKIWDKKRQSFPFEVDGMVVKINNLSYWEELGIVGKGPRYLMAYKFAAVQATTKVKNLYWQVGRTGVLTPVVELEPVRVAGVTVSHSTLHNMDEIERLDLKIGDTIIIERAGDVIPKVVKVLKKLRGGNEKKIEPPTNCPICSSTVEKLKGEVAYKCTNKKCYAVNLRKLIHFASKSAMDIEWLGKKVVEQLVQSGFVKDISDFYALSAGDLISLERFAEKSADNLLKAIQTKKIIPLDKFLYSLGIHHVGEETALLLAKHILNKHKSDGGGQPVGKKLSIDKIIKFYQKLNFEDLQNIKDIGPVVAKSILDWFLDKHNIEILKKISVLGIKITIPDIKKDILSGKTFVLTGTLSSLTRGEAKAKIRELGGDVSAQVGKSTDYVVVGENPGSKYEKAKSLGIEMLKENDFIKLLK